MKKDWIRDDRSIDSAYALVALNEWHNSSNEELITALRFYSKAPAENKQAWRLFGQVEFVLTYRGINVKKVLS